MALASGLGHTTAIAEESTYGTAVTTGMRGFYVDSNDVRWMKNRAVGSGLRGGDQYARSNRTAVTSVGAEGGVEMDCATKGMGLWLKHSLGGFAIAQVGATPAFKQTFTPAELKGRSLTVQGGHPLTDGSLQPFTFTGTKVTEWGLSCDRDGLLKYTASLNAQDGTLGTGYATPSWTLADAAGVFSFAGASVYVAGSGTYSAGISSVELSSTNGLTTDRPGHGLFKGEPLIAAMRETTLTVDSEFADVVTWVARNHTDETFAVRVDFIGAVISGAETERLSIILPAVKVNDEDPTVGGPDVLTHSVTLMAFNNGSSPAVQVEYVSTDAAA